MAGTPYTIDAIKSMVLTGNLHKQLAANQLQLTNAQNRLVQLQTGIVTLQAQLRALQIQVLASLTPAVNVEPNMPIAMSVNNDGTVVLTVG